MDDLAAKLESILHSPEGMDTLQNMISALGIGNEEKPTEALPSSDSMPDMTVLLKLAPMLSGLSAENDNTRLLGALRPYLHGEREKRLDTAIQMMRLAKLLPLLQEL